jgi:hypothetical protein
MEVSITINTPFLPETPTGLREQRVGECGRYQGVGLISKKKKWLLLDFSPLKLIIQIPCLYATQKSALHFWRALCRSNKENSTYASSPAKTFPLRGHDSHLRLGPC